MKKSKGLIIISIFVFCLVLLVTGLISYSGNIDESALNIKSISPTYDEESGVIVNQSNGVLIQDSPESFAEALEFVQSELNNISKLNIRSTLDKHTWENIVRFKLIPILNNL